LLAIISIVNFVGIRESAWTNTIFTIIEVSGLILIFVISFMFDSIGIGAVFYKISKNFESKF